MSIGQHILFCIYLFFRSIWWFCFEACVKAHRPACCPNLIWSCLQHYWSPPKLQHFVQSLNLVCFTTNLSHARYHSFVWVVCRPTVKIEVYTHTCDAPLVEPLRGSNHRGICMCIVYTYINLRKNNRLGDHLVCRVLPGIESSTSQLRIRCFNYYTFAADKFSTVKVS